MAVRARERAERMSCMHVMGMKGAKKRSETVFTCGERRGLTLATFDTANPTCSHSRSMFCVYLLHLRKVDWPSNPQRQEPRHDDRSHDVRSKAVHCRLAATCNKYQSAFWHPSPLLPDSRTSKFPIPRDVKAISSHPVPESFHLRRL